MPNIHDANKRPSNDDFLSTEEQRGLIDRIENLLCWESNINDWELGFLDTCLKRVQGGRDLTKPQYDKLETIEIEAPLRLNADDFGNGCGPSRHRYWGEDIF